jgi:hypothetical protein
VHALERLAVTSSKCLALPPREFALARVDKDRAHTSHRERQRQLTLATSDVEHWCPFSKQRAELKRRGL